MDVIQSELLGKAEIDNLLEFDYSFGYNCRKYYNLIALDEVTLLFTSENFLHFFNVNSRELTFQRSTFGTGIGCVAKNPCRKLVHFAVGENGEKPTIFIYNWPTLEVVKLIKNVAKECFESLSYSPNGTFLISYSGKPDHVVTVHDWEKSTVLFKSYADTPINELSFSSYSNKQFTSFGADHIKFWKIVDTFTGIKLVGREGKFDKTNVSEILCAYHMPDDTVISGSEWGNILVWKDGYIKVEIGRMLNKKCHDAPITQFMYKEDELWSISMDGHIKIWHYKSIENKKFLENRLIAVEPIYEFCRPQIMFMGIHKVTMDFQDTSYFVQDGNGGIWNIDLNTKTNPKALIQLYKCHGGAIMDIAACPWGYYLASLGSDGRLQLYQYVKKKLLYSHQYPAKGTCMIWLSLHESSDHMIMGFDDGNVRVVVLTFNGENIKATTTQVIKSHTGPITNVEICKNKRRGVSSSDDGTIFIYSLENIENCINLIPIGFVPVAICISYLKWHLYQDSTIVMGSTNGCYFQLPVSEQVHPCTEDSYMLQERPSSNSLSKIVSIFENSTLRNRILWFIFVENDVMWLSMDGSDSGFIYEHNKSENTCELIYNANGVAINNCTMSEGKTYIVLTMSDGNITVTKTNPNNMRDFSISWELSLHNSNSFYSQTCFSNDEKYLFTSWQDGNIFSYKVNINQEPLKYILPCSNQHQYPKEVEDNNGYTNLSLEELKIKIKNDLKSVVADQNKETLKQKLKILRTQFEDLLKRNNALPLSQIIPKEQLEIHRLITQYFKEQQQVSLACVNEGLARALEKSQITLKKARARFIDSLDCFPITVIAICNKSVVKTVAQRKLIEKFDDTLILVEEKIENERQIGERMERVKFFDEIVTVDNPLTGTLKRTKEKKDVLFKLPPGDQDFGPKLSQLLDHYNIRKLNLKKRKQEWEEFTVMKPLKVNCVEDQLELCQAIETVGDYKLKSDQNYKVPKSLYTTVAKKYHCLLQVSLKKYKIIHEYNIKVYRLRESRVKVLEYLHHLLSNLRDVQEELEEKERKVVPNIPNIKMEDFPETNLEVVVVLPENDKSDTNVKIIQPSKGDFLEKEILINDEEDSEWELEARHHRKARKLFQQDLLLSKIHKNIQRFDDAVSQLANENCTIMQQINLLDLHVISLNQELIILKKFEATEQEINAKIYSKVEKLYEIQNNTQITTGLIYEHIANANQLLEEKRNVKRQFLLAITGNTHSSYFKKIFNLNETTTSEEMSESFSDESDGSVDTTLTDIDSTVVCNSELYKVTLEFKAKKIHINECLNHLKDLIDKLNGDLQLNSTRNTRLKREIESLECEMEEVQKEKQDQLNEVMCTIILKLDQLQHLKSANTASKIGETLVFSQSTLTNLYERVGQLHQDTVQQEIKHKECITHICRMKTDFHQMKEDIKTLEQATNAAINKKVGMVIPVDLIEEVRLRDKLFKFNLSRANVKASYRQQLVALNEAVKLKQIELRNVTKENTARLNMLTEINCEKTNLIQTIRKQSTKKKHLENVVSIAEKCKENIEKLSNIIKKQNQDIEILRNEIKRLSFKSLPVVNRKISDDILNLNLDIDKPSSEIYQWKPSEELSTAIDLPFQQHFTAQVQIPLVISDEAEELVIALIMEMCETLQVFNNASRRSVQQLLKQILPNIMERNDVDSIIRDLMDFLSMDFNYEKQTVIKETAHQIYKFLHIESITEDFSESAKKLLIKVIKETVKSSKDVNILIEEILQKLVQCLPMRFLIQQSTVDMILAEIRNHLLHNDESLLEAVLNISTDSMNDLQELLDSIIETVYRSK